MTKLKKKNRQVLKGRKFYIFISKTPAQGLCFSTVHGIDEQFTKRGKEFSLNCFLSSSLFQILKRWQATGSANFLFSEMPRWHAVHNSGPQPFQHQGPVLRKTIFPWTLGGCVRAGWFQDDSSMLCLLCILFLLLLHQLHLRSLGIRSRRLGTPGLEG